MSKFNKEFLAFCEMFIALMFVGLIISFMRCDNCNICLSNTIEYMSNEIYVYGSLLNKLPFLVQWLFFSVAILFGLWSLPELDENNDLNMPVSNGVMLLLAMAGLGLNVESAYLFLVKNEILLGGLFGLFLGICGLILFCIAIIVIVLMIGSVTGKCKEKFNSNSVRKGQ